MLRRDEMSLHGRPTAERLAIREPIGRLNAFLGVQGDGRWRVGGKDLHEPIAVEETRLGEIFEDDQHPGRGRCRATPMCGYRESAARCSRAIACRISRSLSAGSTAPEAIFSPADVLLSRGAGLPRR